MGPTTSGPFWVDLGSAQKSAKAADLGPVWEALPQQLGHPDVDQAVYC